MNQNQVINIKRDSKSVQVFNLGPEQLDHKILCGLLFMWDEYKIATRMNITS
jgi:hypothetical protein